jgi:hypothetical protein
MDAKTMVQRKQEGQDARLEAIRRRMTKNPPRSKGTEELVDQRKNMGY